jgi:hypothetical protein
MTLHKKYRIVLLTQDCEVNFIGVTPCGKHYFRLINIIKNSVSSPHWVGEIELLDHIPDQKPLILLADDIEKLEKI